MKKAAWLVAVVLLVAVAPPAVSEEGPGAEARAAFARFKGLAGPWKGRSTRGWTDTSTIRVIAGGSVVEMASFDAHPGEEMRTLFHLDGDRLLLTHYCVAGNQPRLVASRFEADAVTFTYLDATGIASREQGHMDKAVYPFAGDGRYTTRWTWYQDGQERWLQEIHSERMP
jgi:hypothetical protein